MAYDNFENTPFDLNHDGHIDSNEAAYIYDTFFNEDTNGELNDVIYEDHEFDHSLGAGAYTASSKKNTEDVAKSINGERKRSSSKGLIAWGIVVLLAILFPDSLGVAFFAGMIFLSLKLSGVF